ncbi:hypothetical protein SAMN05444365_101596 [Micromonospora pattaloongensis]|uniref:Uncharacterized protein n=1 Tax=Micromonospora pattaloongensis TaxID=405436 RepID=A0A1H3GXF3_9ACTN|nr:hypothetical protein SAMN05444365_101596 [Micromonospora pattaloongensis]
MVVVWALLLVGLGYLSARRDPPSVREQRSIGQATPVVDRATAQLLVAAGRDVVADIAGRTLDEGCRITPLRSGGVLYSELTLYTSEAGGPALLDRIAGALPGSYGARVRHDADQGTHALRADAGEFVTIRGRVDPPGAVILTVSTGCRPVDVQVADLAVGRPIDEEPMRVLAALGAAGVQSGRTVGVSCPVGSAMFTAHATGRVDGDRPFADALRPLRAGATVVLDTPERFAYRTETRGVVVQRGDDQVRVSVTAACAAG